MDYWSVWLGFKNPNIIVVESSNLRDMKSCAGKHNNPTAGG